MKNKDNYTNKVLKESKKVGISILSEKTNKEVIDKISKYDNMYGTLGIHPESVDTYSIDDINYIKDNKKE